MHARWILSEDTTKAFYIIIIYENKFDLSVTFGNSAVVVFSISGMVLGA